MKRNITRHEKAHGVGSYRMTNAVKGFAGTHFTNQALMRSHSLFLDCIEEVRRKEKIEISTCCPGPYTKKIKYMQPEEVKKEFVDKITTTESISSTTYEIDLIQEVNSSKFIDTIGALKREENNYTVTELYFKLFDDFSGDPFFKLVNPLISTLTLFMSGLNKKQNININQKGGNFCKESTKLYIELIDQIANNAIKAIGTFS